MIVTRFAPSPTGRLHPGHAYAALFAFQQAMAAKGRFLLRIEDIDPIRCHRDHEDGIFEDLAWLGLVWEQPVRRQSEHMDEYQSYLDVLSKKELLYPCFCTRKEIRDEVSRAGHAPHGPEGLLYPGTCKNLPASQREELIEADAPYALRLDMTQALVQAGQGLEFHERSQGKMQAAPDVLGDVVLARKDIPTSYHLSVTIDDHLQGVTLVTRSKDLLYATHLHRLLQALLDLDVPEWHHHDIINDENGERFAKRNAATTLQHYREQEHKTPRDIMAIIGYGLCLVLLLTGLAFFAPGAMAALPDNAEPDIAPNTKEDTEENAREDAMPDIETLASDYIKKSDKRRFLTLSIENDSLGRGTDRHYTSGVRLTYLNVNTQVPDFIKEISGHIPTFRINPTTSIAYSVGQNLYTPDDLSRREQASDDRPWAGWLYASAGLSTITRNHVDELELTLGMVGPAALGKGTQKFVHNLIDSPNPKGWDNQLRNEPGVIISWLRRWPYAAGFEAGSLRGGIEPNINLTLGNIYSYAGTGLTFRLGPQTILFQDHPPRVRPAMPGSGYYDIPPSGLGWYLFAGIDGRAVGRNIFLDGNTFRNSHSIDKKYFVMDANAGIALTLGQARMSYSAIYRTKEFRGQNRNDLFGSVSLSWRY